MKKDLVLARRIRGERALDRRDMNIKGGDSENYYHLPYVDVKDGMVALQKILS